MTTHTMPDILFLDNLLAQSESGNHRNPTILELSSIAGSHLNKDHNAGWWELLRIVHALPALSANLPGRGAMAVASRVAEAFGVMLSPEVIHRPLGEWLAVTTAQRATALSGLLVFQDLAFDQDNLNGRADALPVEIEGLRALIAAHETLPEATKVLLVRQLDLLQASLARFRDGSVGPFSMDAWSVYGRIKIILEPLAKKDRGAFEVIIEKAEGIFSVVQILTSLGSGDATALLAAPAAVRKLTDQRSQGET